MSTRLRIDRVEVRLRGRRAEAPLAGELSRRILGQVGDALRDPGRRSLASAPDGFPGREGSGCASLEAALTMRLERALAAARRR